jgi:hypothetical protein
MTDTTTFPQAEAATGPAFALHPTDVLTTLIVALLAPMFLGVSAGNIDYARMAAFETVNAYRARNHADLLAIAQIVAYGLAALGSLSLSMAGDISLSMTLRLRGNANALGRSAEQNRRAIRESRFDQPAPHQEDSPDAADTAPDPVQHQYEADVAASLAATRKLVTESRSRSQDAELVSTPVPTIQASATLPQPTEQQLQTLWAEAMIDVAGEFSASLLHLPAAERKTAWMRAAALSSCATQLLSGAAEPVFVARQG